MALDQRGTLRVTGSPGHRVGAGRRAVFLPTLDGPSAHNLVVLGVLGGPARHLLDRSVVGVRLRGRVTGRTVTPPVQYATHEDGVVVVPVRPLTG